MMASGSYVIVIAGAYRSGTTWMFNAVRLLMQEADMTIEASGWIRGWDGKMPDVDVWIVKDHKFFDDLAEIADVVLTSVREWEDATESWYRFKGVRLETWQIAMRKKNLIMWQDTKAHRYCMPYELLVKDPERAFADIRLCVPAKVEHAKLAWPKLQELKPPTDKDYDPETMMFRNHITAGT